MFTSPRKQAGRALAMRALDGPKSIARSLECAPVLSSDQGSWPDLAVCSWRVQKQEFELLPVAEICLTLNTGDPLRYRGDPEKGTGNCAPGQICLIAPEDRASFVHRGTLSGLSIHLSTRRLSEQLGSKGTQLIRDGLRTRLGFDDAFVWGIAHELVDEIRSPTERGTLYAEALADALGLHLLRPTKSLAQSGASPSLSGKAVRAARELLDASLETGVSLDRLAREHGMSRHQFSRAFQRATGSTPHRYLTRRRIERAKALLRESDLPLAEIAFACGFASQSHFCDRFRSMTGSSPGRYRGRD